MNRKRQVISTAAGIILVCLLFTLAMVLPGYYTDYTDKKLLDKMEYINASYDAYEVSYTSFVEKIKAIGKITSAGNNYNSVKINDNSISYKNINKIIRKEFNVLYKCGVLKRKIRLRAGKITSCEKYMLYPSAGNNNIKGITFIKTVYKLKKGEIEVYIDEEYHKIYDFTIPYELYIEAGNEVVNNTKSQSYDYVKKSPEYTEPYYTFLECLFNYFNYNISGNTIVFKQTDINNVYSAGFIEFEDGTIVEVGRWVYTDLKEYVHIGSNLKYKL